MAVGNERRPVQGFYHPEIVRLIELHNAQQAEILGELKEIRAQDNRILAQNAEILANQRKLYGALIGPPAAMHLAIKGDTMPLTVDSASAVAVLSFEDDHGDAVAPPAGALAVATSSDTAVLTVGASVPGADANGVATITFPLTEVAEGTSSLSVAATDASGNPLLGPDGVTPIPAPAPVDVTVNPGAPAAEVFTVPGD